jgi:glycosyltransferase involved in cell wall biosynthesis
VNVLLVSNYPPDRQESMLRFADCLAKALPKAGVTAETIAPQPRFAKDRNPAGGAGKWLAYVDKFLLFPRVLRKKAASLPPQSIVHVCDHSNAMYVTAARKRPTLVTCHDLLAVRGALGEDVDCPASATGKVLQKWILSSLARSNAVVCDSAATAGDFRRLAPGFRGHTEVVLLGQNNPFRRLSAEELQTRLAKHAPLDDGKPFVLMVGSALSRKNREGALRIFRRIADQFPGRLVFAGAPLNGGQRALASELKLTDRIVEFTGISDEGLETLYNAAHALLFPSSAEGFGWPVLEAQACGCPVVCSNRTSVPEVAGDAAFIRDLKDEAGFAEDLLKLSDEETRRRMVEAGFCNAGRLTTEKMIEGYLAAYRRLLAAA